MMKTKITTVAIIAALYGSALATVTIDYVTVGNAGNAADPLTGYGSVSYAYNIGKYEVTNAQYAEFLNAADPGGSNPNSIYSNSMGSDARGGISFNAGSANGSKYSVKSNMGNKPVIYVSWYNAARFANWLHNGQGNGSTETGAYTLSGNTGIIAKNVGATVWIPNVNEWYKAAYYDPTVGAGGGDNYWFYPTQSDATPTIANANLIGDISNPGVNVANYGFGADWNSQNGNVTTVGSAGANNYFGTFDQGGNVIEWTDDIFGSNLRIARGGRYNDNPSAMSAQNYSAFNLTDKYWDLGFRVASIPEPSSIILSLLVSGALLTRRRRA
jgi:formylglycine-generating enzyme required for sulfatase activity